MSYQVLARKWRPRSFSELAGQTQVLKTLINSLENNRLHHAYLFTGTRGVGKTTIARILARCLNCETGITATPCGQCGACRAIDEGRFIDLIEVDAASRTKVEDTRELLENVQYSPTNGRFKVYLIDEVHMLSTNSFNALLKTLEEPPPHVKFLLATTDPQKLPVTVLSRCLQFNLKNLSPEQLVEHLTYILKAEDIAFEESALWQLGRAARGSVRDSLTLLDQAIAYCNGTVSEEEVSVLLGTIDQAVVHKLVDALVARDGPAVLAVVQQASEHGADFAAVLEELMTYLHRMAIAQVVPGGIDNSQGDRAAILAHARALPGETVQLYYQIGLKGREDLPLALDARSGLEMCLLRMLAYTPEGVPNVPVDELSEDAGKASDAVDALKKKPEITAAAESEPVPAEKKETPAAGKGPETENTAAHQPSPSLHVVMTESARKAAATAGESIEASKDCKQPVARTAPQETDPEVTANRKHGNAVDEEPCKRFTAVESLSPDDWIALYQALGLTGITGNMAANALLAEVKGSHLHFLLEEAQASLLNADHSRRIERALSSYFGVNVTITLEPASLAAHSRETPARWRRRQEAERHQQAVQSFEKDEAVKEILQRFSGEILPDSIEALTPRNY